MRAYKDFIVSPIGERYNNSTKVGDKELILNTEIYNHHFVNRLAKVIATPLLFSSPINVGDEVIVHHNVFRRWHNVRGEEKNSKSWLKKGTYAIYQDQLFAYNRNNDWKALDGYCFVKPIKPYNKLTIEKEEPLMGIVKYTDGSFEKEDLVGFTPDSEYEFIIDNQRLYRVMTKEITIKYEYQGKEEEYNPGWL